MAALPVALLAGAFALALGGPNAGRPQSHNAKRNLKMMLQAIKDGEADNNFFNGGMLIGVPESDREDVAGCMLDKVMAIVTEDWWEFIDDLQVDLAACCTKDADSCSEDVKPAYKLLRKIVDGRKEADEVGGEVAGILLKGVEKRISRERLASKAAAFYGKCPDPASCTIDMLKGKEEL